MPSELNVQQSFSTSSLFSLSLYYSFKRRLLSSRLSHGASYNHNPHRLRWLLTNCVFTKAMPTRYESHQTQSQFDGGTHNGQC
ncbi:hypothetical protein VFPPC_07591 [Pochonia chlamydosporia 170]|uniref:Uncharacterized protein n=1 Tax=Pochonia chlamydosporia 170 TaxID=1380566 RepID=A0A179FK87_METCM|nr:hypothetical protein VFPPC_07591 [Pochonia chlamydosporia 170]OAQ65972.1 hypothetical protein VFPPC_07591 [Pochonia chlamydosporia 170]